MNEFAIEWVRGGSYAGITVPSGSALKSKILKYAEERPEEVEIIALNEDGSIFAHIPISYIKVTPPKTMSEEGKEAVSKRIKHMWEQKKQMKDKQRY